MRRSRFKTVLVDPARRRVGHKAWVWGVLLLLSGCSSDLGGDNGESLTLERLEIAPSNQILHTGEAAGQSIQFSATAYWSNGVEVPQVAASWRSSNNTIGSLSAEGVFTPAQAVGGVTYVTGAYLGQEASTLLTVVLEQTIVLDGLSDGLMEQVEQAEVMTDDDAAPFVLYPFDGVILPRNIARLDVHWNPANPDLAVASGVATESGLAASDPDLSLAPASYAPASYAPASYAPASYAPALHALVGRSPARMQARESSSDEPMLTVLDFTSITGHTRVLTLGNKWIPSPSQWASIAATNSGGSVTLQVMGGRLQTTAPANESETPGPETYALVGPLYAASEPMTLGISRLDTTGAIYYWSISDRGIKRISNETQLTQDFYVASASEGGCVSCHTLSPVGDRMSVVYPDPGGGYRLGLLGLTPNRPPETIVDFDDGVRSGRGAFSPDGRWFLGVDGGRPALYDGRTGAYLQPVSFGFEQVANVSFSPEGDEVAFAVPTTLVNDSTFFDARLATIPFDEGLFGEATWLTPRSEGYNQYYPTYSPDGNWIAYNQSVSTGVNQPEGDSLMDASSQVYLIARGGGSPILLRALGAVDESRLGIPSGEAPPATDGIVGYANSLPVWGPLPDADLLWLSFSTYRGFGHDVKEGIPQIWLSAIEPSKAEKGQDPSHAPFWLPLQDPVTHNHLPQWGPY